MTYKKVVKLNGNRGYYFPLFNEQGLRSSITPFMGGDVKINQHSFATAPISELDLFLHGLGRNVIFEIDQQLYYLNGQTERQQHDDVELTVDLLYQKVTRKQEKYQIDTTSYVHLTEPLECHEVIYTNKTQQTQTLRVTVAVPIYARSADNIRDHRHVTSLLNRIDVIDGGVCVKPTMKFDERGHQMNHTTYSVLANSDVSIKGYIPTMEQFINGGSIHFPKGLNHCVSAPCHIDGYEAMGGIQFTEMTVKPNETMTFYYGIAITEEQDVSQLRKLYLCEKGFHAGLKQVKKHFYDYAEKMQFSLANDATTHRTNWIVLQPLLRRYYGNSFMPHHDYGKGGKGWRDLWQDLLSLIMMGEEQVPEMLASHFKGVRLDGSNATIIGETLGSFKADRNQIVRVWSDHGAWPLLTVKQYLDETGDIAFLFKKVSYFHDQFTHYTHRVRQTVPNITYQGSILEHLLLQNLIGFFHRGAHGFTKLEDADWNDGNDMAKLHGETIAFTHFYTNNLLILARLIEQIGEPKIIVFEALSQLLNEQITIQQFFDEVALFNGYTVMLSSKEVSLQLRRLAKQMIEKLQQTFDADRFQSYYDEKGELFDQENTASLTGQAMALLSKTASPKQAASLAKKVKALLFEEAVGGYHLNSKYDHAKMGRAYGFAYNHKENGAVFSHMSVMYAYGLYVYDLVEEGRQAAFTLLKQADQAYSSVLLGIPEYFTDKGVGKYHYLTGSASWFLKLLRDEVFGLSFDLGVLRLKPKLLKADFKDGKAVIKTFVFGHIVNITYYNPKQLTYGQYGISKILVDGKVMPNEFNTIGKNVEVYLDDVL